jgi:hypothetical protein
MSDAFDRADAAGKLNATLNATQASTPRTR